MFAIALPRRRCVRLNCRAPFSDADSGGTERHDDSRQVSLSLAFRSIPATGSSSRGDEPVELNARYFDALALLVREAGKLVSKDRFLDEVWRGVPVTDEALTQCIKTLRRQLGDQVAVAALHRDRAQAWLSLHRPGLPWTTDAAGRDVAGGAPRPVTRPVDWRQFALLGRGGHDRRRRWPGSSAACSTVRHRFARRSAPGVGEASALLVLIFLTMLAGVIGGAGVGFGIAASALRAAAGRGCGPSSAAPSAGWSSAPLPG